MTIVGVGPANHRGTVDIGVGTDLWLPITAVPAISQTCTREAPTIFVPLFVKARLREASLCAQARAAMDVLGRRLEAGIRMSLAARAALLWPRHHGHRLD